MKKLKVLWDHLEEGLLLLLFLGMIFTVLLQVVNRQFLHLTIGYTEELARFMYIYTAFIGFSCAIRLDTHLRIDLLPKRMSPAMRRVFNIAEAVITIGVAVWLISISDDWLLFQARARASALRWPMKYIYIVCPVSMALVILRSAEKIAKEFLKIRALPAGGEGGAHE